MRPLTKPVCPEGGLQKGVWTGYPLHHSDLGPDTWIVLEHSEECRGLLRKAGSTHPSASNSIIVNLHQLGFLWPEPGATQGACYAPAWRSWAKGWSGDRGSQTWNRPGRILPGSRAQADWDFNMLILGWIRPRRERPGGQCRTPDPRCLSQTRAALETTPPWKYSEVTTLPLQEDALPGRMFYFKFGIKLFSRSLLMRAVFYSSVQHYQQNGFPETKLRTFISECKDLPNSGKYRLEDDPPVSLFCCCKK